MNSPVDAAMLQILDSQLRELTLVLRRLEWARVALVPNHSELWRGSARGMYDSALDAVAGTVDAGILALRSAVSRTRQAVAVLESRG